MSISLGFTILLAAFACGALFGYAILQPFAAAVQGQTRPTRFVTADFFCLAAFLSVPMSYMSALHSGMSGNRRGHEFVLVLGSLLIVAFTFTWWRGAATLSGLGIYDVRRRVVFLLVLLPVAIIGSAVVVPLFVLFTLGLGNTGAFLRSIWLGALVTLPLLAYSLRRLSKLVLKGGGYSLSETGEVGLQKDHRQ